MLRARLSDEPQLNERSLAEHHRLIELLAREEIEAAGELLSRHVHTTASQYVASRSPGRGESESGTAA